jgi:hypothetical protein
MGIQDRRGLFRVSTKILYPLMTIGLVFGLAACGADKKRGRGMSGAGGTSFEFGPVVRPIGVLFAGMDRDLDRVVSLDEAFAGIDNEWASVNGGEDQRVTAFEISAWAKVSLGDAAALPNHITFDRDLDGEVTEVEFTERLRIEFGKLDRNDDKQITRAEIVFELPNRPLRSGASGMRKGGARQEGGGGRRDRRR